MTSKKIDEYTKEGLGQYQNLSELQKEVLSEIVTQATQEANKKPGETIRCGSVLLGATTMDYENERGGRE